MLVTSCAGDGQKTRATHLSEMRSSGTKIFVSRSTGYTNSANRVKMTLNGKQLKSIGNKESIGALANTGSNSLTIAMGGAGSIGTKDTVRNFNMKAGEKKYFVINQDTNLFGATLKVYEVSEKEFLNS